MTHEISISDIYSDIYSSVINGNDPPKKLHVRLEFFAASPTGNLCANTVLVRSAVWPSWKYFNSIPTHSPPRYIAHASQHLSLGIGNYAHCIYCAQSNVENLYIFMQHIFVLFLAICCRLFIHLLNFNSLASLTASSQVIMMEIGTSLFNFEPIQKHSQNYTKR